MPKIEINGTNIFYQEGGNGEPLIFIHGLGSRSTEWHEQTDFFSRDFHCIAVDLRGHGESGRQGPYNIHSFSQDIIELIKKLELAPAHLVGISLGGMTALQVAVDEPYLVKTLTVVNALPEFKLRSLKHYLMYYSRLLLLRFFSLKTLGKYIAPQIFPGEGRTELRRAFMINFSRNSKKIYHETILSLRGWNIVNRLQHISCRTLFLTADHDYTLVEQKKFFASKIENAQVVEVKDSGHGLPAEKPAEFNRILHDFLIK